jgi:hypothetical protein
MYFEQMLFLIPQTQDRATSSNYSPMTVSDGEDADERRVEEDGSNDGTAETYTCRKKQSERNNSRKINFEQQVLDILKEKSEHIDEDKTFLLSLVPGFKKLDDDQKYWAKMEILGIMRRAKDMVFQPQYTQL